MVASRLPPNRRPRFAPAFVLGFCFSFTCAGLWAQARWNPQDADRFETKLTQIVQAGILPSRASAARSTHVSDAEVNSYLHYKSQIPVGIVNPEVSAVGGGRVSGHAFVDLDAVRTQKTRSWGDPLGYLTGKLPVVVSGVLTSANGRGQFQLESASLGGVPIPKSVLQELLSYYSRTAENPAGIDMDQPFALPARIREIRVGQGETTIVQ